MNASTISRKLRAAGIRPLPAETPYTREGIRVKNTGTGIAYVVIDIDADDLRRTMGDLVAEVLSTDYVIERSETGSVRVLSPKEES